MPSRPKQIQVLKFLVGVAALIFIAVFIYNRRERFLGQLESNPSVAGWLAGAIALTILSRGIQLHVMLHALDVRYGLLRSTALTLASQVLNYLPLRPGTVMQAVALKKSLGVKYSTYAGVFTAQLLLLLGSAGLLGLLTSIYSWQQSPVGSTPDAPSGAPLPLLAFYSAVFLAPVGLFLLPRGSGESTGKIAKFTSDMLAGWSILRQRLGPLTLVIALIVGRLLLAAFRLYLALSLIGVEADFSSCLLLGTMTQLSFLLSITPGAIGTRQVLVGAVSTLVSIDLDTAVLASSFDHAVVILVEAILGIPAVFILLRNRERQESNGD